MVTTTNTWGYWIHNLENVFQPVDLMNILTALRLSEKFTDLFGLEDSFILITSHVVQHQIKMLLFVNTVTVTLTSRTTFPYNDTFPISSRIFVSVAHHTFL